jgi:glycosyltransferase involved in cell wall biosynthesis
MSQLGVGADKITVIPVALGRDFRPRTLTPSDSAKYGLRSPYILYVGNFKPHKNVPRLLEAYAALPASLRAVYQLVLAGSDEEHRPVLHTLANQLGVGDRVVFPGLIADEDLSAIYSGCALFVLPSLYEGFGLPALEAMACGAAVAAANRTAIPEVVDQAALLFDPEQVGEMTRVMQRGITETGLREQLRDRGLARARVFSQSRTSGLVLDLLQQVVRQAA